MSRLTKFVALGTATLLGIQVAKTVIRSSRNFSWKGKRVVITGGSRGLGLVIARQLAREGAQLAICSRTEVQLHRAAKELRSMGATIVASPCDVRDPQQVTQFIQKVASHLGGIDVLFNVAGIITVGPLDAMDMVDFEDSMQTNCWGSLRMCLAALPYMRDQLWGRIVNVASVGGKRAIPHMLPYAASKFALVGLSNGLNAELRKEGIYVTTVCPGLMRTGSPRNANFKGRHREEYAWFSIGDSIPLLSLRAEEAAAQIIDACQDGRGEVFIHHPWNLTIPLQSAFPGLASELVALADRLLPKMGGIGKRMAKGYESESKWSPSALTGLNERAAAENNEF